MVLLFFMHSLDLFEGGMKTVIMVLVFYFFRSISFHHQTNSYDFLFISAELFYY